MELMCQKADEPGETYHHIMMPRLLTCEEYGHIERITTEFQLETDGDLQIIRVITNDNFDAIKAYLVSQPE